MVLFLSPIRMVGVAFPVNSLCVFAAGPGTAGGAGRAVRRSSAEKAEQVLFALEVAMPPNVVVEDDYFASSGRGRGTGGGRGGGAGSRGAGRHLDHKRGSAAIGISAEDAIEVNDGPSDDAAVYSKIDLFNQPIGERTVVPRDRGGDFAMAVFERVGLL